MRFGGATSFQEGDENVLATTHLSYFGVQLASMRGKAAVTLEKRNIPSVKFVENEVDDVNLLEEDPGRFVVH